MKKLLSVLLCVTMLVTMMLGTVGFAAVTSDSKGSITVNALPEGTDVTITAYKVVNVDFNEGRFCGYSFDSSVQTWMKANGYEAYVDGANGIDALAKKDAAYQESFYSKLAAALPTLGITPTTVTSAGATSKSFEVGIGEYLLVLTDGTNVYKPNVANVMPKLENGDYNVADATVAAKLSKVTIEKTADGSEAVIKGLEDKTVSYEINALVPDYPEDAINKTYVIKDSLSEGLTYNYDTFKVTDKNGNALPADSYAAEKNERGFVVTFDYDKIASLEEVCITYTAALNEKAVIGPTGNNNTVTLQYANNPTVSGDYITKTDETKVFTYEVDVLKYDGDSPENNRVYLAGAIFKLEKLNTETGNYEEINRGKDVLTTDANGKISLTQLEDGKYKLTEIQAPGGYNKLTAPIEFTITAVKDANGKITGQISESETGIQVKDVPNYKTTMPSTGGTGTVIFTVVGIVLMLGAVLFLGLKKKRTVQ